MTRVGRGARALVLSLLAVLWGTVAHGHGLVALGSLGPASLGPLVWSGAATALLAWWTLPPRPTLTGAQAGRGSAVTGVAAVAGAGQALTHAALAVTPLLTRQTGRPLEAHVHVVGAVTGTPDAQTVLTALGHGGVQVLVLHTLATLTVALLWASAGALWSEATAWWDQLVATTDARAWVAPRTAAERRPTLLQGSSAHLSWDGRAPPATALP
ncbi:MULTISPECIES: hypothetical protein [unclassified Ornithinimicrobium]|uniref:hypothetical protein n=1 Tax=unclassified Ornithinimicrobium TaxID=2615080 RepID=UPI003852F62E